MIDLRIYTDPADDSQVFRVTVHRQAIVKAMQHPDMLRWVAFAEEHGSLAAKLLALAALAVTLETKEP